MAYKVVLKENKKGFTLTELLIVVSIIVFLVLLVIFYLRTQIFKGNDAKRKGDVHKIQIAMEEYEKDHDCYPTPDIVVCKPGTGLTPYLEKIPCDPVTKSSYFLEVEDSTCPFWYRIYIVLENPADSDIQKVGCRYGCGPTYAYNFFLASPNAPEPEKASGPGTSAAPAIPDKFWGCISGVCQKILWDPERPGPVCDPNYQNPTCYGQCGAPSKECINWKL